MFNFRNKYVSNILLMTGGTLIAQGLVIGVSPILTRIYSPSDFGIFATYTSIILILNVISSLKYELAIPLGEDDNECSHLFVLTIIILSLFCVSVWLLLQVISEEQLIRFNLLFLKTNAWLIPLSLMANGLYQSLNYWVVRDKKFKIIAKTKVYQGISLAMGQTVLGLLKINHFGLILGDIFSRASGIYSLAVYVKTRYYKLLSQCKLKTILKISKKYKRFPLISTVSSIINSSSLYLPTLFIVSLYGDTAAGYFALAQRFVTLPISLLGQSISNVYLSEISQYIYQDNGFNKIFAFFCGSIRKSLIISLIPTILIFFLSPYLFGIIFGDDWIITGELVQALCIASGIDFCVSPLSQTLNIINRQDVQMLWDCIRFCLVILGFFLCNYFELKVIYAIWIYSIALSITYLILAVLIYVSLKHKISTNITLS